MRLFQILDLTEFAADIMRGRCGRDLPGIETAAFVFRQPQDLTLTKRTWGAFASTDLAARLKERGVTQVVIAGFSTSIGVESTARQAFEGGFNVTLAIDAMTDTNADAHANSIERIFPRLGETGRVDEIVALLERSRA